jgi:hypothetical protein
MIFSMGIEQNFRTSTLKKEIIDSLIEMHIEESPVTIWQNENGKRHITKAKIDAIDFVSDSIYLIPYSEQDKHLFQKLKSNITFYLRGNSKDIVFKHEKNALKNAKGLLQLTIPSEVKMQEKRAEERLTFKDSIQKYTSEIFPGGSVDLSARPVSVEIKDVSLSGMGLFIEKKNSRFFFEKDKIKIVRIGNHRFPHPIHAEVVYSNSEHDLLDRVRVGVRFHQKLTNEILNNIKL